MFNKYLINQKIKFKKFLFFIFFLTLFFFPFRKTKKILNLKRKEERNNKAKQWKENSSNVLYKKKYKKIMT